MSLETAPPVVTESELAALDPRTSQQVFRAVMTAFAHPGRVVELGASVREHLAGTGITPAALPLLALADLMTGVAGTDRPGSPGAAQLARVAGVTGAPVVELAEARFVLGEQLPAPTVLAELTAGTPLAPSRAATLCLGVDDLAESGPLRLQGPGVPGHRQVTVAGVDADWLAARAAICAGYPCGIDLLFLDRHARCLGWPRTTVVTLTGPTEEASR